LGDCPIDRADGAALPRRLFLLLDTVFARIAAAVSGADESAWEQREEKRKRGIAAPSDGFVGLGPSTPPAGPIAESAN